MKLITLCAWLFTACLGKTPNILFMMMDDMGYGDLSIRNGEFWTPNLDELYRNSVVLDAHYIGISVCSPSRAQILTGRYAWNFGLSSLSNFQTSSIASMPVGVPTIANLLKQYTEYRTYMLGKWHVGYSTEEHTPLNRGFDEFYGFLTSGIDYYDKTMSQPIYDGSFIDWWANEEIDVNTQNVFSTQATADRITTIIDKHANEYSDPFYIYGSFQAPHENLGYVSSKYESHCDNLKEDIDISDDSQVMNSRYAYCLNMVKVDEMVENIVSKLKQTHLWQNTLIVVTSDNGGAYKKGSCNFPLTGGKSTYFEGGVRTVAFVGGGYVKENQRGTGRSGFMHGSDWTPTLLSIAGADVTHVELDLHTNVYKTISESVSMKLHDSFDYADDYLMDSSLDGIDLSQWLLNGDESANPRTDVPLSINSLPSDDDDDDDDDEKRRLMKTDHEGGDISIIFQSGITNNVHKLIYSPASTKLEKQTCNMREEGISVELSAFLTNKVLFDLTLDTREETNIMDNVNEDSNDRHRQLLSKNNNNKNSNKKKKSKNSESDYYDNMNHISDYQGNTELAIKLWNEGIDLASSYSENAMFSDYLQCSEKTFLADGDPSQFENEGWQPFFSWNEYTKRFNNLCGEYSSEALTELYTKTYDTFVESAKSKLESKGKNDGNIGQSSSINTHMFGTDGSHTLMTAGIILAISMVVLGYCLFFLAKKEKSEKYQKYTAIGP